MNAGLAVATTRVLETILPVDSPSVVRGLRGTFWPGRFQVDSRADGQGVVILDGAHNRPAFEALTATLQQVLPGKEYSLVLGMLGDKDSNAAVEWLVPGANRVVVVPVQSRRGADPGELTEKCLRAAAARPVERAESFADAMRRLASEPMVLATGSLYLVGEAIQFFEGGTNSERRLNEWSRSP